MILYPCYYTMKNLLKIWALSVALIAVVFVLSRTSAAAPGSVSFSITWVTNTTCTYGTARATAAPLSASYSAQVATSSLANFVCVDTEWQSGWHMDLLASWVVTNGLTSIPATGVSMKAATNTVTAWSCTAGTNTTTLTSIWATAGTIMKKNAGGNQICTITTASVELQTAVPASATIGNYVWALVISTPW